MGESDGSDKYLECKAGEGAIIFSNGKRVGGFRIMSIEKDSIELRVCKYNADSCKVENYHLEGKEIKPMEGLKIIGEIRVYGKRTLRAALNVSSNGFLLEPFYQRISK